MDARPTEHAPADLFGYVPPLPAARRGRAMACRSAEASALADRLETAFQRLRTNLDHAVDRLRDAMIEFDALDETAAIGAAIDELDADIVDIVRAAERALDL